MFAKLVGSSSVNLLSPMSTTMLSDVPENNPSGRAALNEFDLISSTVKFFIDSNTSTVPLNLFDSSTRYFKLSRFANDEGIVEVSMLDPTSRS
mmetsp:Transcript_4162/g.5386  ORF Transcript_4162/g.5386 Transcript_4162/m.5386 type:complete len:93 (+) Transcript_4162:353-631(+)